MKEREELLDIKQAASFLNVSETSLRRWTNEGLLPCLRVGRRRERRFRTSDLLAFMESQPAPTRPAAVESPLASGTAGASGLHLCAFYRSDAERTRLALGYVRAVLTGGGKCLVLMGRSIGEAIVTRLQRERAATEIDGRLVLTDYASTIEAQLAAFEQHFEAASRNGDSPLHVIGDLFEMGRRMTPEELTEYESSYDQLVHRYNISTMCLYDARLCGGLQLLAALRGHPDSLARPAEGVITR